MKNVHIVSRYLFGMESITPINLDPKMNMPAQIINEIDKNACQLEKEGYLRVARAYRNKGEHVEFKNLDEILVHIRLHYK